MQEVSAPENGGKKEWGRSWYKIDGVLWVVLLLVGKQEQ
jgi:hypothetical protein